MISERDAGRRHPDRHGIAWTGLGEGAPSDAISAPLPKQGSQLQVLPPFRTIA
jgi:hypothetical protein